MKAIADNRPVLHRTGLTGDFDFVFEFVRALPTAPAPNIAGEESGSTLLEALEQLGLKLKSTTAAVDCRHRRNVAWNRLSVACRAGSGGKSIPIEKRTAP